MKINSPIFSGSITQAADAYANLSGSFTGSFTGSFKGSIDVQQASFDNLTIKEKLTVSGSFSVTGSSKFIGPVQATGSMNVISGSVNVVSGSVTIEGVSVLDTALAYSIALG